VTPESLSPVVRDISPVSTLGTSVAWASDEPSAVGARCCWRLAKEVFRRFLVWHPYAAHSGENPPQMLSLGARPCAPAAAPRGVLLWGLVQDKPSIVAKYLSIIGGC